MNKPFLLSILTLSCSPAFAVINGTSLDWANHDNIVRLDSVAQSRVGQCTGTMVAGKYILTAAHCLKKEGIVDTVMTSSGQSQPAPYANFHLHPSYLPNEDFGGEDVGWIELDNASIDYQHIQFFPTLTSSSLTKGQDIFVTGFGGTALDASPLNRADFQFDKAYLDEPHIYIIQKNTSHTAGGDSGSAWTNANNEIIGIHKGSSFNFTTNKRSTYGTDLHYASDFILDTVNGWHYPTVAQAKGQMTITIQSLHQSVNNPDPSNEMWTEGDVKLVTDSSGCFQQRVTPYTQCTLRIESQGGEGTLWLSANESIKINKPIKQPDSGNGSASSSGGGALGFWSLLMLLGFTLRRQKLALR
ncbi:TPA: trypsin-like serine protease [Vibrio vulnificus]|nr:trypsin-like serine protease [Vibrio vulnificus]